MADLFIDTSARLRVSDDSYRLQRYPVAELGLRPRSTLGVSRTKEGSSQPPVSKCPPCNGLCDGALARPSKSVQPVDGRLGEVAGPELNSVQNCCARPAETITAVSMLILGLLCRQHVVEDSGFGCKSKWFQEIIL